MFNLLIQQKMILKQIINFNKINKDFYTDKWSKNLIKLSYPKCNKTSTLGDENHQKQISPIKVNFNIIDKIEDIMNKITSVQK